MGEVIKWAHCNNAPASFLSGANAALDFWNMFTSPRCVDFYALINLWLYFIKFLIHEQGSDQITSSRVNFLNFVYRTSYRFGRPGG